MGSQNEGQVTWGPRSCGSWWAVEKTWTFIRLGVLRCRTRLRREDLRWCVDCALWRPCEEMWGRDLVGSYGVGLDSGFWLLLEALLIEESGRKESGRCRIRLPRPPSGFTAKTQADSPWEIVGVLHPSHAQGVSAS